MDGEPSDGADGAWIIGLDPATGATKFRVPLQNSTDTIQVPQTGLCGAENAYHDEYHAYLSSPIRIAGDGSAYVSYEQYVFDALDRRAAATVHPYPDEAYPWFDKFYWDLGDPSRPADYDAALADLAGLGAALGESFLPSDPISVAVQAHDRVSASTIAQARFGDTYTRPCDRSSTFTTTLHLMRIGVDGSPTDVVVKEWRSESTLVFSPSDGAPGYHITETQVGPDPRIDVAPIITNADQGAIYSWQIREACSSDYDTGVRSYRHVGNCGTETETQNHLTTTSGGAIAADVVWHPGAGDGYSVELVLQLEDGSFAGAATNDSGDTLLVSDASGGIRWIQPGYRPLMASKGGGLIAISNAGRHEFDAFGNAVGQVSFVPTYSWFKRTYEPSLGGVAQTIAGDIQLGTTFALVPQGNLSSNGTYIGTVELSDGFPLHGLQDWGRGCAVPPNGTKVLLDAAAQANYDNLKASIVAGATGGISLVDAKCSLLFTTTVNLTDRGQWDRSTYYIPNGQPIFDGLANQRAFDGPNSNLSILVAGLVTSKNIADSANNALVARIINTTPVCYKFLNPGTNATSQAYLKPGRDIYLRPERDPIVRAQTGNALRVATEGTILHELLHNLTGLDDFDPPTDLKTFIGLDTTKGDPDPSTTHDVTQQLIDYKCVVK